MQTTYATLLMIRMSDVFSIKRTSAVASTFATHSVETKVRMMDVLSDLTLIHQL